ncbi:hypothetical protein [Streptosporangium sp. NPDC003464]
MTSIRDLVTQTGLSHDALIRDALPGLSRHVRAPLVTAGIATVRHLARRTDDDLLAVPQFGQRRLEALRAELERVAREQAMNAAGTKPQGGAS